MKEEAFASSLLYHPTERGVFHDIQTQKSFGHWFWIHRRNNSIPVGAKELGDVVIVDIPAMENPAKGKALDMAEAAPVLNFDAHITGTSDYADTKDSDLVIITAGVARKPGMSRDDLVQTNQKVMKSVTKEIVAHSPNATILVLTNPVDAMTYTVFKESGFPKNVLSANPACWIRRVSEAL